MNKQKTVSSFRLLGRVLRFSRRYLLLWGASLLLALISVAGTLYLPILIGQCVDQIIGPGQVDLQEVRRLLVIMSFIIAGTALAQWFMNLCNNRLTYFTVRNIRRTAFDRLQTLPVRYFDAHPSGDLLSRMISDVDTLADGLLLGFTQCFTGLLTILGTLLFMLMRSPVITLVVVVLTPLSLFLARFIANRTYALFKKQSALRGEQTQLMNEMIGSQKLVQAFSYQKRSQERFDDVNDRLVKCSLAATFFSSITNPVTRFVNSCVYAGVALSGALCAVCGMITVGTLTSFLSYANQYTKPFNEISGVIAELQNALACAGRIFELIDEPVEEDTADAGQTLGRSKQIMETAEKTVGDGQPAKSVSGSETVEFRDVSFAYDPQRPLIEHLNVKAQSGQRIAIVGPTGSGKTTLINLLMRFYDPQKGVIEVGGQDIREMPRKALRKKFGMVLQDTWLRAGTIRDNLLLGMPEATEDQMLEAARLSRADRFIRRLPKGYDTPITESGDGLSQGQKQLLCITRVMLARPSMLILDEATSSIDTRTEIEVQEAFDLLMKGRTSFVVAHRLSTVVGADEILVMDHGRIVEQGTHEALLTKNGFYARLYEAQFAGVQE